MAGWKFHEGDSTSWSRPDYNYQNWEPLRLNKRLILNKHQGIYWLKTNVLLPSNFQGSLVFHYYLFNAACEIYWDGKYIDGNGKVGTNVQSEKTGKYANMFSVPITLLAPGVHEISIKVSNYHYPNRSLFGRPNIGTTLVMQQKNNQWVLEHTLMTTVLGLTIFFCILLFFGLAKNKSLLYFMGFCIVQMLELLLSFYGVYQNIDIGLYNALLDVLQLIKMLDGFFLVGYLVLEFRVKPITYWLLGAMLVSVLTYWWAFYHFPALWLLAAVIVAIAIIYKKHLAFVTLVGLVGWAFLAYWNPAWGYFWGLVILMMSMIIVSILQMYKRVKQQHQIELRTSRLENQLLKKNIQPHFLMNSLISLQQIIHEDPFKAEDMINELASEFHIFSRVAEKKLIAMKDELKLCQAHLRIMEYRKGASFVLEIINITGEERIPPAIFHTLVENGITHGYGRKNKGRFVLEKVATNKQIVYRLYNDGESSQNVDSEEKELIGSGTGMKYIKARLNESYGKKWKMDFGRVDKGWETVITLPI
ncbi:hypothetical protein BKI52_04190 [marine bacterium AO1-C]|nr:hypothetical protein BKI52_04190 [marine bacterium AO1-C]